MGVIWETSVGYELLFPLNAEFETPKNKGKVTIPFTVYGKKYKAVISVKP